MQIKAHLDPNFESMTYYPTVYFNEFWVLRENLIPLNETVKEVDIAMDLTQMPMWKFTIFSQVEKSFEMQVWDQACPPHLLGDCRYQHAAVERIHMAAASSAACHV